MLHFSTVGKMIEVRTVILHKQHVISWDKIANAICEKMGFKHLRGREGGPGFDFWLYWIGRVCEYLPDSVSDDSVDLLDFIECIEEDGFTTPDPEHQLALPILKALAEMIPENALEEGFYVDYC